jgi:hypothetical protein
MIAKLLRRNDQCDDIFIHRCTSKWTRQCQGCKKHFCESHSYRYELKESLACYCLHCFSHLSAKDVRALEREQDETLKARGYTFRQEEGHNHDR